MSLWEGNREREEGVYEVNNNVFCKLSQVDCLCERQIRGPCVNYCYYYDDA